MKEVNKHSRMIDKDFLKALSRDGILYPVTELVYDRRNELLMAFRGKYINIYYRGHSLYKIEQQNNAYAVTFNFNHARYSDNYNELLQNLLNLGMELPARTNGPKTKRLVYDYIKTGQNKEDTKDTFTTMSGNNTITKKIPSGGIKDKKFWNESYGLLKQITDDFFDLGKEIDFFKDDDYYEIRKELHMGELEKKKSPLLEKQHQQSIALANRATDDGYFVYDIEYAQPTEKQGDKKPGRFDMLALKIEDHKAVQLLFIELKTTKQALGGKSGIEKHKVDMDEYMTRTKVIDIRYKDSVDVMDALDELFHIGKVDFSAIEKTPVCAFVCTDEAREYKGAFSDKCNKLEEPWVLRELKTI